MAEDTRPQSIRVTTDLSRPGRHFGDAMLRWSDNSNPLGYHPVPVISLKGRDGPVLLLTGGTHGDEFEGPAAIMRLVHDLDPESLRGQIIAIPALNMPALSASARVSPLDGANLNRAFPGDPLGGPTAMLANWLESAILPRCDAAIDLHSGGKASVFVPCALPTHCEDGELAAANMTLARAFGCATIWRLGRNNDDRSVNAAAARAGVPMIAAELGGGGGVDPDITDLAETGIRNVMAHLGMIDAPGPAPVPARVVELADPADCIHAPGEGIFDRRLQAGAEVAQGTVAGRFHFITEPERPPLTLTCPTGGLVLAHGNRGFVRRGALLALVVRDVEAP